MFARQEQGTGKLQHTQQLLSAPEATPLHIEFVNTNKRCKGRDLLTVWGNAVWMLGCRSTPQREDAKKEATNKINMLCRNWGKQ